MRTYIGSYWSIIKVGSKSQLAPNYLNGSGIQELKIQKSQRDVHGGFFISDTINADFFAYSFESFAALMHAESCLKSAYSPDVLPHGQKFLHPMRGLTIFD